MKYRHAYHAGNFADVHKHVTLLALLAALKRKDKGFLYLETHAGRGAYDLSDATAEARAGIMRFAGASQTVEELQHYARAIATYREQHQSPRVYPGSPVLAAMELRPQDRAILIEKLPPESRALERSLAELSATVRVECNDGYERMRAHLPPAERRGLLFIDPPYEEQQDFSRVTATLVEALRRFQTGVFVAWYPIKDERETAAWHTALSKAIDAEMVAGELWLYPRDSRVALNGSGMLIVNPPYLIADRMREWLPALQTQLDAGQEGGTRVHILSGQGV